MTPLAAYGHAAEREALADRTTRNLALYDQGADMYLEYCHESATETGLLICGMVE